MATAHLRARVLSPSPFLSSDGLQLLLVLPPGLPSCLLGGEGGLSRCCSDLRWRTSELGSQGLVLLLGM